MTTTWHIYQGNRADGIVLQIAAPEDYPRPDGQTDWTQPIPVFGVGPGGFNNYVQDAPINIAHVGTVTGVSVAEDLVTTEFLNEVATFLPAEAVGPTGVGLEQRLNPFQPAAIPQRPPTR